jgi:hypothetical protein
LARVRKNTKPPNLKVKRKEGEKRDSYLNMMISRPSKQPRAKLNLRLNNETECRWIQVDGEQAVKQVLEYGNDAAERKVTAHT